MKAIKEKRNVKAHVPLVTKPNKKIEFAMKNPPNLKPKNRRVK